MFYRRNIGTKQALARLIGGGLMILCGLVGLQASLLGLLLAGAGGVTMVTGVLGYCPVCSTAGPTPPTS
ncbi:DUF2892 domain-containing protein [Aquabacterium sp. A7-Y]|uniref:YgaP-like transmembrane domain n=1 Tax=Aquabacterium sp. A7-Y TaxID=1349605 RepID=UPI00223CBAA7|nr:YgaP-like transmembrane domain [Aquabacterium sp. A7-Y]MCW7539390.1 DUF2892 domain-containing protein [Aquabacterium sp. A7-Y]